MHQLALHLKQLPGVQADLPQGLNLPKLGKGIYTPLRTGHVGFVGVQHSLGPFLGPISILRAIALFYGTTDTLRVSYNFVSKQIMYDSPLCYEMWIIMPITRQGANDAMTPESIQAMIDRAIQRNSTHT
uniref:Uncharacterized protein n=1 Tax=Tanacetum cinerariifolium TaxID=118510 RepID=A0A699UAN5_TANCI|nr:hypothetical protein [Tanacetum cinerariifolium]